MIQEYLTTRSRSAYVNALAASARAMASSNGIPCSRRSIGQRRLILMVAGVAPLDFEPVLLAGLKQREVAGGGVSDARRAISARRSGGCGKAQRHSDGDPLLHWVVLSH